MVGQDVGNAGHIYPSQLCQDYSQPGPTLPSPSGERVGPSFPLSLRGEGWGEGNPPRDVARAGEYSPASPSRPAPLPLGEGSTVGPFSRPFQAISTNSVYPASTSSENQTYCG